MDDGDEGPLVIAQRYALQAERYASKGHYTQAIDRYTRAAKHYAQCSALTSDTNAHDSLHLLATTQLGAAEQLRKLLYGPAHAISAAAAAATATATSSTVATASIVATTPATFTPGSASSFAIALAPLAVTASATFTAPTSIHTTPFAAAAAIATTPTPTATTATTPATMSSADAVRALQLRRALDALALAATTDEATAAAEALRSAERVKGFATDLRNKLSSDEESLSRSLSTPLLATPGAAATPTPTGAAAQPLTFSTKPAGGSGAETDVQTLAAALSSLRAQLFQISVNEKALALENAALKQRLSAYQSRTTESHRLLHSALAPAPGAGGSGGAQPPASSVLLSPEAIAAVAANAALCNSDVCNLEKKKLKDKLNSTNVQLASEIALRQKQSKLLESYSVKLKHYDEKWDKLKHSAAAASAAKRNSLTSPPPHATAITPATTAHSPQPTSHIPTSAVSPGASPAPSPPAPATRVVNQR